MLMLLDIAITGGVNLRPNFSPGVYSVYIIIYTLIHTMIYTILRYNTDIT